MDYVAYILSTQNQDAAMPIHTCRTSDGKTGYQWGEKGTCYPDRADAEKQAQAAYANGYTGKAKIPGSLYVQVTPDREGIRFVRRAQKFLGLKEYEPKYEPHVTVMYSREAGVSDAIVTEILAAETEFMGRVTQIMGWPGHDGKGWVVLCLRSQGLDRLHAKLKLMGARHSFPVYEPHITLAKGVFIEGAMVERVAEFNQMLIDDPVYFLFDSPVFDEVED